MSGTGYTCNACITPAGCQGQIHARQCAFVSLTGKPDPCRDIFSFCEGHGGDKRAMAECQAHMDRETHPDVNYIRDYTLSFMPTAGKTI